MLLTTNFNIKLLVSFGLCLFTTAGLISLERPVMALGVKNVSNTSVKVIANFTDGENDAITVESGVKGRVLGGPMDHDTPQLNDTFISLTIIYPDNYKLILDRKAVMKLAEWDGKSRWWTLTVR